MFSKVFPIVLITFVFYSKVDLANDTKTLSDTRQIYAIGIRNMSFPEDLAKLNELCDALVETASDPQVLYLFPALIKDKPGRIAALETAKAVANNRLCKRVKDNDQTIIEDLKQINEKNEELVIVRDNIINIFLEGIKFDTPISPTLAACYLKKYVDETAQKFTGSTKKLLRQMLNVFRVFFKAFEPAKTCPWLPLSKTVDFSKQTEMLYVKASASIYNKWIFQQKEEAAVTQHA